MSKSLGNIYTLKDLEAKKFNPLALRYLILTSHYRSKLNFTWKSLTAAQNALNNLIGSLQLATDKRQLTTNNDKKIRKYEKEFLSAINDDLNTPKAIALVWQIIKNKSLVSRIKKQLIFEFDKVLGLELNKVKPFKIPREIKQLTTQREKLRANKQFIQADVLRKKIEELGYILEDAISGSKIRKNI